MIVRFSEQKFLCLKIFSFFSLIDSRVTESGRTTIENWNYGKNVFNQRFIFLEVSTKAYFFYIVQALKIFLFSYFVINLLLTIIWV